MASRLFLWTHAASDQGGRVLLAQSGGLGRRGPVGAASDPGLALGVLRRAPARLDLRDTDRPRPHGERPGSQSAGRREMDVDFIAALDPHISNKTRR